MLAQSIDMRNPETRAAFGEALLNPTDPHRRISASDMQAIALWAIHSTDPDKGGMPEELPLPEEVMGLGVDDKGKPNSKPNYEMRYRDMQWRMEVQGEIGHIHFMDMVRSYLQDIRFRLTQQQSNGDWVPCAYVLDEHVQSQFAREQTGHTEDAPFDYDNTAKSGVNAQMTRRIVVKTYSLRLRVAYIDRINGDVSDNWLIETGRPGSPISKYAETGLLKHMPRNLKKEREACLDIIEQYYEMGKHENHIHLSESDAKRAAELFERGLKWGELAKIFGVPWQTVKRDAVVHLTGKSHIMNTSNEG